MRPLPRPKIVPRPLHLGAGSALADCAVADQGKPVAAELVVVGAEADGLELDSMRHRWDNAPVNVKPPEGQTMNETHNAELLEKQGSEWTNDLGQTFPARPLYRAICSCGWKGAAWYSSKERALTHFARHVVRETAAA